MEPDETKAISKQVEAAVTGVTELAGKLDAAVAAVTQSAKDNAGAADEKLAAKATEIETSYKAAIEEVKALVTDGSSRVAQELKDALVRIEELELSPQRPGSGGAALAGKSMGQLWTEKTIDNPEFKSLEAGFREGRLEAKNLPHVQFKTADWLARKALALGDTFPAIQRVPGAVDMVAPPNLIMRNLIGTVEATGGTIEYLRYQGAGPGTPKSVTSITRSGTVATVTVTSHGYRKWDRVLIAAATQTEYNGYRHILSIIDANSFTVRVVGSPATPATGTITVVRVNQSGAPEVVAEAGTKPLSAMRWTKETASLVLLAHAIEVTRQTLWHVAGIQAKIDNELMVGLDRIINYQSLWSAGGSGALQGLMTLPATDTQTYAWSEGKNGDTKVDAIRRARTRLEVLERFPTGVILGPEDWEDIELAKGSDLHYIMMPIPGLPGQPQLLWRMPVLVTSAMDTGSFLEADFPSAATYYLGQDAQMYMTDSDGDNFRKNIITILAEIELQLVVENPSAIVVGTFDAEPS